MKWLNGIWLFYNRQVSLNRQLYNFGLFWLFIDGCPLCAESSVASFVNATATVTVAVAPPPRPSSSASINSFHFEQLHLLLLCLFCCFICLVMCMCVSVKFATVWNCGKSSSCLESFVALVLNDWPCCLLLRSQRAYVNNHFVRPSGHVCLRCLSRRRHGTL